MYVVQVQPPGIRQKEVEMVILNCEFFYLFVYPGTHRIKTTRVICSSSSCSFHPCLFLLGPAVCSSKWLKSHPFSNAARPHLFWDHLDHHRPDHPDSPSLLAVHETPWPKILPLPPNWTHSMLGCPGCFGCLGCVPCVGLRR